MRESDTRFIISDYSFKIKKRVKLSIEVVRSAFARFMQKIAFQILKKVNSDFVANFEIRESCLENKNLEVRTDHIKHTAELGLNLSEIQVVSADNSVLDQRLLATSLRAIFTSNETYDFVCKNFNINGEIISSHKELIDRLQQWLQKLLLSHDGADTTCNVALEEFLIHKKTYRKNTRAYSLDNRINADAVFWPSPVAKGRPRSIFAEYPFAYRHPFIEKHTPVGSAGSCFAFEIARKLQKDGFDYVITEPNSDHQKGYRCLQESQYANSCAAWGTIFNAPSFRQLIERAFGFVKTPNILYTDNVDGKKMYFSPFREAVAFDSVEAYRANYLEHLEAVRQAFLKVKVFIMTLGVNEVWYFIEDGSVYSRVPWKLAPGIVGHKILSVKDNVDELNAFLRTLRFYNPECELIISVSPVPLFATFRGDTHHVATANCHSKSTLRVAAEEFCAQNSGVHYMPSYESVIYCSENAWEADQRHVSRVAVDKVMKLFNEMFVKA